MADYNALAAELIAAKERKSAAEAELKEANKDVGAAESALFKALVDNEVDKVSANGYTFSPDMKDYFSVPAENAEAVYELMVELGLDGIYKMSANAQTFQATMRDLADRDALPETLVGLVTVFNKEKVNMRKAAR